MKTPEEIKKGLECCTNDSFVCNEKCPYFNSLSNGVDCSAKLHADTLVYTQQLEAQNAELVRKTEQLQSSINQVQKALQDNGFQTLEELLQAFIQVKRERDAAVSDLKSIQGWQLCNRCKNYGRKGFNATVCIECINGSRWEWRGVPEKEGENNV